MNSIPTPAKAHALNTSRLNTAKRMIPARRSRTLTCNWDLLAAASLLVSSAAYGVYAVTQMI